jgi:Membrane-bound metallopeptidase
VKKILLSRDSRSVDITQHQIKFLQHRLYSLIEDIAQQIIHLSQIKSQTQNKQQQLQQHQADLQIAQEQLVSQKQQRAQVLTNLRQTIRAYQSESESLNQDRQRLNQLLAELTQLLDDLPEDLGENAHFAQLKGQLDMPLNGDIIRGFGTLRAGNSRWDGIVVAGQSGQPVTASAYGRVAFADWLRGYGLLVVIDHGDDYMSLYGHNQSLLVEVGDWVQAGQEIATAGQSGNISQSGVYFEIRKQAKPENPKPWLKSR